MVTCAKITVKSTFLYSLGIKCVYIQGYPQSYTQDVNKNGGSCPYPHVYKGANLMNNEQQHHLWMEAALVEAKKAASIGEVPIGAVIVKDGTIIGRGHNLRETNADPLAHAELMAIREASASVNAWRLSGCQLYVTLEPCAMCAGAIVQARIDQVVYATTDPKAGCAGTLMNLLQEERFNHQTNVISGVLQAESAAILREFFQHLRKK